MECNYCGKKFGDKYFCKNCNAPREVEAANNDLIANMAAAQIEMQISATLQMLKEFDERLFEKSSK